MPDLGATAAAPARFEPQPVAWTNFAHDDVLKACRTYGPILDGFLKTSDDGTGNPIIGARLLWALAGNESSFGANCKPRFEQAYWIGGLYAQNGITQKNLNVKYPQGAAAHSYGPWQIMPCNAIGFKCEELATDLEKAAIATIGFIRRFVIGVRSARTLAEMLDVYNSGTWRDSETAEKDDGKHKGSCRPGPDRYIHDGLKHYREEVQP